MSLTTLGVVLLIVGTLIWLFVSGIGFYLAVFGLILAVVGAVTHR